MTVTRHILIGITALLAGCVARDPHFLPWPPKTMQRSSYDVVAINNPAIDVVHYASALEATVPEDTNAYFDVSFSWRHTNSLPADRFRLYYGPAPGFYLGFVDLGTQTSFYLSKTNWGHERRYFAVTAFIMGVETDYSNEVFWPPEPDSHYRLRWVNSSPLTIVANTNSMIPRALWPLVTRTSQGATNFTLRMPSQRLFFAAYRTNAVVERLSIETFNPTNDQLYAGE